MKLNKFDAKNVHPSLCFPKPSMSTVMNFSLHPLALEEQQCFFVVEHCTSQ